MISSIVWWFNLSKGEQYLGYATNKWYGASPVDYKIKQQVSVANETTVLKVVNSIYSGISSAWNWGDMGISLYPLIEPKMRAQILDINPRSLCHSCNESNVYLVNTAFKILKYLADKKEIIRRLVDDYFAYFDYVRGSSKPFVVKQYFDVMFKPEPGLNMQGPIPEFTLSDVAGICRENSFFSENVFSKDFPEPVMCRTVNYFVSMIKTWLYVFYHPKTPALFSIAALCFGLMAFLNKFESSDKAKIEIISLLEERFDQMLNALKQKNIKAVGDPKKEREVQEMALCILKNKQAMMKDLSDLQLLQADYKWKKARIQPLVDFAETIASSNSSK